MSDWKKWFASCICTVLVINLFAQDVPDVGYTRPTDRKVLEKLEHWQDLKFGVLFHWGLYSVPGICESWGLCSEDVEWISRKIPYEAYKKWYYGMKDKFNPTRFNPEQWAEVMKDAGMKYMIFTTKHHDGFCMFDSRYTDFSVASTPFRTHPKMNVAYHVFDAFRRQGFMTGCYFSKPDWHCEWYWSPFYSTPTRRENYKRERHPEWWKKYQEYTMNQLDELMSDYGSFDILWLDGGWVSGDEINLDQVLAKARTRHPGLISVDRTIRGRNENYQTPEKQIPQSQLDIPWESCIPLGNDWGWTPDARLKSPHKILNTLIEICAKGGCFVLGVGPTPEGIIQEEVADRLHVIGKWLRANGEAIYNTRNTPHYNSGDTWFTASKDGRTVYALYALPEGKELPETITWEGNLPEGRISLVSDGRRIPYSCRNGKVTVRIPEDLEDEPLAFRFRPKKQTAGLKDVKRH